MTRLALFTLALAACDGAPTSSTWAADKGVTCTSVQAAPGDLVITEIMADPTPCADDKGEWIEVRNISTQDVDLCGTMVVDAAGGEGVVAHSLVVAPGDYAVLGRGYGWTWCDSSVEVDAFVGPKPSLNNDRESIAIVRADNEEVIDDTPSLSARAGKSRQLRPDAMDPLANDEASAWECTDSAVSPGGHNTGCGYAPPGDWAPTAITFYAWGAVEDGVLRDAVTAEGAPSPASFAVQLFDGAHPERSCVATYDATLHAPSARLVPGVDVLAGWDDPFQPERLRATTDDCASIDWSRFPTPGFTRVEDYLHALSATSSLAVIRVDQSADEGTWKTLFEAAYPATAWSSVRPHVGIAVFGQQLPDGTITRVELGLLGVQKADEAGRPVLVAGAPTWVDLTDMDILDGAIIARDPHPTLYQGIALGR